MSSSKVFDDLCDELDIPRLDELESVPILRDLNGKQYWETKSAFVQEMFKMVVPTQTETLLDVGCGRGLIVMQFALSNTFQKCMGVEAQEDLAGIAEENTQSMRTHLAGKNQPHSRMEILELNILHPTDKIGTANVVFLAADDDPDLVDFHNQILLDAQKGTRFVSNLELLPPVTVGRRYKRFQQLHVQQDLRNSNLGLLKSPKKSTQNTGRRDSDTTPNASGISNLQKLTSNTTMKDIPFVAFRIITIKTFRDHTPDGSDNREVQDIKKGVGMTPLPSESPNTDKCGVPVWKTGLSGFVPIQHGAVWKTFRMTVIGQRRVFVDQYGDMQDSLTNEDPSLPANETLILHWIELECPWSTNLLYSFWALEKDMYFRLHYCDVEVKVRNGDVSAGIEEYYPTPGYPKDCSGFEDVMNKILPIDLVRKLGLRSNSATLVPGQRVVGVSPIDFLDDGVMEYLKTQNLQFNKPIVFSPRAMSLLKARVNRKIFHDILADCYERHCIMKTLPSTFADFNTKWTMRDFLDYLSTPYEEREAPMAVMDVPIAETTHTYFFHPPEILLEPDLVECVRKRPSNFRNLSKTLSLMGAWTISRFRSQGDSALTYISVVEGTLLLFLMAAPLPGDYEHLSDCTDPKKGLEFVPPFMKGRVTSVLLQQNHSITFPGNFPHALIACEDTYLFGGRFIIPQRIPDIIWFLRGVYPNPKREDSYSRSQIARILFNGAGKVFSFLFKNIVQNERRVLCLNISKVFGRFLSENSKYLPQSDPAKWDQLRTYFGLLQLKTDSTMKRHACGVMYKASAEASLSPILEHVFGKLNYKGSPFNSIGGNYNRIVFIPIPTDLDFCTDEYLLAMIIGGTRFEDALFYHNHFALFPRTHLVFRDGLLGMYSLHEIELYHAVSEYTGQIIMEDDTEKIYGEGLPPGRIHLFSYVDDEGGPQERVLLDANRYGSQSLFYRQSDNPNCAIIPSCIGGRRCLIVYAAEHIPEDVELTVPFGLAPEVHSPIVFADINVHLQETFDFASLNATTNETIGGDPLDASSLPRNTSSTLSQGGLDKSNSTAAQTESRDIIADDGHLPGTSSSTRLPRSRRIIYSSDEEEVQDANKPGPSNAQRRSSSRRVIYSSDEEEVSNRDPNDRPPKLRDYGLEFNSVKRWQIFRDPSIPNFQSRAAFRRLDRAGQAALRRHHPRFFYPDFDEYDRENQTLLRMYKKAHNDLACGVCAHHGKIVEKHAHQPFHNLSSSRSFFLHWKRIHNNRKYCPICGYESRNKKAAESHLREMVDFPNRDHIEENRRKKAEEKRARGEPSDSSEAGSPEKPEKPKTKRGRPRKASKIAVSSAGEDDQSIGTKTKQGRPKKTGALLVSAQEEEEVSAAKKDGTDTTKRRLERDTPLSSNEENTALDMTASARPKRAPPTKSYAEPESSEEDDDDTPTSPKDKREDKVKRGHPKE